jgi:hypothetical protein
VAKDLFVDIVNTRSTLQECEEFDELCADKTQHITGTLKVMDDQSRTWNVAQEFTKLPKDCIKP